ncbi:MAG: RNA polymerase factor sigma-54 [Bacteroidota bacterium]
MLKQKLQQKLQQKLSPQQIQLMKLLQIPTVALEQRIKEEIENNPTLEEGSDEDDEKVQDDSSDDTEDFDYTEDGELQEESKNNDDEFDLTDYLDDDDIPSYKLTAKNAGRDEENKTIPFAVSMTFHELLISQLGLQILDEDQYAKALHLIGSIDDDGYLRRHLSAIVDDMAFSQNIATTEDELLSLLEIIQDFDPPGVGARDLRECLRIQLKRKAPHNEAGKTAMQIIDKHFIEFTKKHYDKITVKLNISLEKLKNAIDEILKLNPKPGNSLAESQKPIQYIVPDFTIVNNDGALDLSLNSSNAPELRVSKSYSSMLMDHINKKGKPDKKQKETLMFVKQKLDAAKWFIDAIKQRQETLIKTMAAIINYQKEYFQDGDDTKLKPMILKDIAEMVNLDISTISRVANSKYVQTPFGTFLLKTFFSESLQTDSGEEVSTREIKKILEDCIAAEYKKKPLADEKLTKILKEKGYNIARRTIAKYREQLNIPVARLRKEL